MLSPEIEGSAAEFGALVGISERRVRELRDQDVIPDNGHGRYNLRAALAAYCGHLREVAAGRAGAGSDDDLDLASERARLAKEQADAQAMKNALARGEVVPKADVVAGIQVCFANARARLLGIPVKAAPALAGEENLAVIRDKLTGFIHEACGELAAVRAVPSAPGWPVDGGGGDGGDGAVGAPAVADGERVGRSAPRAVRGGKRRTRPMED